VLINCAGIGDGKVKDYCEKENVPIMAQIPYDREIAVLYSYGIPMWTKGERYRNIFRKLWESIECELSVNR